MTLQLLQNYNYQSVLGLLGVLVPQNSAALAHDISAQCSLVNVFRHPKLKSSVEGAGGDEFSVRGDVQSHHFPLVTSERLQRGPLRVCPYFGRVVIRSGQQVLSIGGCRETEQRCRRHNLLGLESSKSLGFLIVRILSACNRH